MAKGVSGHAFMRLPSSTLTLSCKSSIDLPFRRCKPLTFRRCNYGAVKGAGAGRRRFGGGGVVLCAVLTNAVEVQDKEGRTLGIALYGPAFSWINHGCSPNACYRFIFSLPPPSSSQESKLRIAPSFFRGSPDSQYSNNSRQVAYHPLCARAAGLCVEVMVVDAEAYTYDDEVIKKAEAMGKPGLIKINAKQDSFIFTVETTRAIKAFQLLNATEILKQKLDGVRLSEDIVEADDQFGELGAHMRGG
ncbi:DNA-directed RNA polymerases II, IV and V subunit [Arachis hypogaea]|nr:DNA-directed RNA polymerases II, IV and V subunit [Arachis hypogaea]